MIRYLIACLLLGAIFCGDLDPAFAQQAGPSLDGAPIAPPRSGPRRFELGLYYGVANFTVGYGDVQWFEQAKSSSDMDLATTPSFGGFFAYGLGRQSRLIATVIRQSTQIEAGSAGDESLGEPGTWRTDMSLLHVNLGFERALSGLGVQPYVTASAGGMLATAKDLDDETWFYSGMVGFGVRYHHHPKFSVRAVLRVPVLFVDGQVIWQIEPGLGLAWVF